ncbi:diaminopimelate decarboxylase [candidate division WOR-3 bacterium]|nr:diaminopimelate decarboxylase [candidate division WOR-3 bacterium]
MFKRILKDLKEIKTPYYIYDSRVIEKRAEILRDNFSDFADLFFAVKANTSISILKIIKGQDIGAEVVSPGEIFIALKSGIAPEKILYDSLARKEEEIEYAIDNRIEFFNFESLDQAVLLDNCAKNSKLKIKAFVRMNPGIFPKTHSHLSTGSSWSKFGIALRDLDKLYDIAKDFKSIELVGVHYHIGSQLLTPEPYFEALKKIESTVEFFIEKGLKIKYVNLGGGFGIPYKKEEKRFEPGNLKETYREISGKYGVRVFLELGRFLVAESGFIITKVLDVKDREGIPLYVVDSGMNDNPRPAIYDAYHHIEPLFEKSGDKIKSRVVGPICENSDEFGAYELPSLKIGDLLIIYNCGAYTRTMASNYNGRLLPAEYLYDGHELRQIRERQKLEGLITNEKL